MQLIHVGYGSIVNADRVIAILGADSAPIKRAIQEARDSGRLIDATYGRKTRSVLVMDSGHLLLSALQSETVAARAGSKISGENFSLGTEDIQKEET
ncbi:MAG TPA: DUF370 domain-containing protein [Candidatus Faecimorpha stercoravium]|nr:DUF370 domain-containing protein [Candidatus Faecimorpha stercoravium]